MRRVVEFIRVACCVMTPCSLVGWENVELGKILFRNSGQQTWGMQTVCSSKILVITCQSTRCQVSGGPPPTPSNFLSALGPHKVVPLAEYLVYGWVYGISSFLKFHCEFEKLRWDYYIPDVCPSVWNNSTPTGRIFIKTDRGGFMKICWETPNSVKIGHINRALYMKL